MAPRTISSLYEYYRDAVVTVRELEAVGVRASDIRVIASGGTELQARRVGTAAERSGGARYHAREDAKLGTVVGAGLGLLAVPGVGPVLTSTAFVPGWLVPMAVGAATGAAVGAAAGGIIGAVLGTGVREELPDIYAEGVRRGGTLVTVRTDKRRYAMVAEIMARYQPTDPASRVQPYRRSGWTGFSAMPRPYAVADVELELEHGKPDRLPDR